MTVYEDVPVVVKLPDVDVNVEASVEVPGTVVVEAGGNAPITVATDEPVTV